MLVPKENENEAEAEPCLHAKLRNCHAKVQILVLFRQFFAYCTVRVSYVYCNVSALEVRVHPK